MIRVPACARVSRVSRVCSGSPRCLFTGTFRGSFGNLPEILDILRVLMCT